MVDAGSPKTKWCDLAIVAESVGSGTVMQHIEGAGAHSTPALGIGDGVTTDEG